MIKVVLVLSRRNQIGPVGFKALQAEVFGCIFQKCLFGILRYLYAKRTCLGHCERDFEGR